MRREAAVSSNTPRKLIETPNNTKIPPFLTLNWGGNAASVTLQLPARLSLIAAQFTAVQRLQVCRLGIKKAGNNKKETDRQREGREAVHDAEIPLRSRTLDGSICKRWKGLLTRSSMPIFSLHNKSETARREPRRSSEQTLNRSFKLLLLWNRFPEAFAFISPLRWKTAPLLSPHLHVLPFEAALLSFSSRGAPRQLQGKKEETS